MRYKSKQAPKLGDHSIKTSFAFLPKKCSDGQTLWLGYYLEFWEYGMVKRQLPYGGICVVPEWILKVRTCNK